MSQENVEKVREGYEAFARGDLAFVFGLLDDEVEWYPAIAPLLGVGPVRGKQALEKFLTVDLPEGFADFASTAVAAEDLGDAVLVQTHYSGRGRASGAPVMLESFSLFRFRDDKIVGFRDYETRAEALEAAGLSE
jgi:ketosteroid isomerase-like protein